VALQDFVGKPLVVNLWATWCPPCRREMPVLAEAQRTESDVTFLFVNQGEGERVIADFLDTEGLGLENVLLDTGGRLGQHVGSTALPTTLFYDAEGRQVGSHLGELSRASLARALERLTGR
ncbi:MAG TPA: peroxiredoxin, partial [Pseudomonas sp.]|nr:peroxiredoxin [Pseudomonas sp.]